MIPYHDTSTMLLLYLKLEPTSPCRIPLRPSFHPPSNPKQLYFKKTRLHNNTRPHKIISTLKTTVVLKPTTIATPTPSTPPTPTHSPQPLLYVHPPLHDLQKQKATPRPSVTAFPHLQPNPPRPLPMTPNRNPQRSRSARTPHKQMLNFFLNNFRNQKMLLKVHSKT